MRVVDAEVGLARGGVGHPEGEGLDADILGAGLGAGVAVIAGGAAGPDAAEVAGLAAGPLDGLYAGARPAD
ncbi:MAG: hypothetical protein ACK559_10495, partial [bacterium]